MSLAIKIISYDSEAKRQATRTFKDLPASLEEDTAAQAKLVSKYVALTNASTSTGTLVKETDIDF